MNRHNESVMVEVNTHAAPDPLVPSDWILWFHITTPVATDASVAPPVIDPDVHDAQHHSAHAKLPLPEANVETVVMTPFDFDGYVASACW